MPADIDTPQENDESHTGIKRQARGALRHQALDRPGDALRAEPLEPVRELRTFIAFVRESRDEERKRLGVTGDP